MYNNMNLIVSNKNLKVPMYIKITFIILIIFFICSLIFRIEKFDIYEAQVIRLEDEYYVQVYVPMDKTNFLDNTRVIIDKKEYDYKIINIDKNYIDYDNNKYMIINLFIDLDEKYLINNNYLILKQKNKNKKLFELLVERIKKGMNL